MGLSEITSIVDLIHYYWAYDKNKNGKLEKNEVTEDIPKYDKNGDGALSPWEVMEAVNHLHNNWSVYKPQQISEMRKANESGRSLIPAQPGSDQECKILFKKIKPDIEEPIKGALLRITYSFMIRSGYLVCDTVMDGIKLKALTQLSYYSPVRYANRLRAYLRGNEVIEKDRIRFKSTLIFFLEDDKKSFGGGELVEDVTLVTFNRRLKFKAGKELVFYDYARKMVNGGVLAEEAILEAGGVKVKFMAGKALGFHRNGSVSVGSLAEKTTIQGMICRAGTNLLFNENGRIVWMLLPGGTNVSIGALLFKSGKTIGGGSHPPIRFYDNGQVESGSLAKEVGRQGMKFRPGVIEFHEDGKVKSGALAEDAVVEIDNKKVRFKAHTAMGLYQNEKVEFGDLAEETDFGGWKFPPGSVAKFNENGQISSIALPSDSSINNYRFKAGKEIKFDSKGRIVSGVLVDNIRLDGKTPAGQEFRMIFSRELEIFFHNFKVRNIRGGTLADDVTIGSATFKKLTFLDSYESSDGKDRIKEGTLAKKAIIDGIRLKANSIIKLRRSGKLWLGTLAEDAFLKPFKGGELIQLFENGKIAWGTLSEDKEFGKFKFKKDTEIGFYGDGSVYRGTLAEDAEEGKKIYKAGTKIELNPDGKILGEVKD